MANTNLGLLTTGLIKQTISAGAATLSTAVPGTDYTKYPASVLFCSQQTGANALARFSAAFTAAGTTNPTRIVVDEAVTLGASLDYSTYTNVTLDVQPNCPISFDSSVYTLKIGGPIAKNMYRIFTDTAVTVDTTKGVKVGYRCNVVYPEWWGADSGANNNSGVMTTTTAAFNAAINSLSVIQGGIVQCNAGWYRINNSINLAAYVSLQAPNIGAQFFLQMGTIIECQADKPCVIPTTTSVIKNIFFVNNYMDSAKAIIYSSADVQRCEISGCGFQGASPWSYCIWFDGFHIGKISNNVTYGVNGFIAGYIYDSEIKDNRAAGPMPAAANTYTPGHAYSLGDIVRPTTAKALQYCFTPVLACTAGTEPSLWPDPDGSYGAPMVELGGTNAVAVAGNPTNTYTRSDGVTWASQGFAIGQYIWVHGYANAANNGLHQISSITGGGGSIMVVGEALTTEAATGLKITFAPTVPDGSSNRWYAVRPPMGILIKGSTNIITGNRLETFWAGFSTGTDGGGIMGSLTGSIVCNNEFVQNNAYGIRIGGGGGLEMDYSVVSNNYIDGSNLALDGIWFDRNTFCTISDNIILNHIQYGIYGGANNACDRMIYRGNQFYNNIIGTIYGQGTNPTSASLTLAANAASTVVSNTAVSATCRIILTATSANAAADVGSATGVYISAKSAGVSFTITHPNNANADKTFDYQIVDANER